MSVTLYLPSPGEAMPIRATAASLPRPACLYPHLPRLDTVGWSFEIRSSKSENRKKSDARNLNRLAAQVLATGGTRGCGQCPAQRPRGQRCLRALGLRNSFGSRPSDFAHFPTVSSQKDVGHAQRLEL